MEGRYQAGHEVETFTVMGITVAVRASGDDTGGAYSLLEQTVPPGKGSPLHTLQDDKLIYVAEGEVAVTLGDTTRPVAAGGSALIPRGVPHNFANRGDRTARILVVTSPGGHEGFMRGMGELTAGGAPDRERLAEHCALYGARILPPAAAR